jgi:hypothetical protein
MLAKIVVGVVSSLFLFIFLGVFVWFAGRGIWSHVMAGEAALRDVPVLQKQLANLQASDVAAADKASAKCDARVSSAQRAVVSIAKYAAPQVRGKDGSQPSLNAAALEDVISQ